MVKPPKPPVSQADKKNNHEPVLMGWASAVPQYQVVQFIDSATQKPVPSASVQVDDDPKYFIADSVGEVMIPYYRIVNASALKVSCVGYSHAVISVDESWLGTDKVVRLAAQPMELQPATVIAYGTTTRRISLGEVVAGI